MKVKNNIWDADDYNKSNGSQYRDARETIEQINKDGANKPDMIVVDIGCGSGNVTKILCDSLHTPKKVFACDFDAQMVDYARKNCGDEKIEYFVQDISVPWESLDERLKKLEGKVDLVWSNRVLHWINSDDDKTIAAKTIGRLLKPGGRCYVNVTIQRDLNEFASDEEREETEKFFNFNPHEKDTDNWRKYFRNSDLSHLDFELLEKSWTFETEELKTQMFSSVQSFIELHAKSDRLAELGPEKKKLLWEKMWEKTIISMNTPFGKNPDTYPRKPMTDHYEQFRIIGVK